jgi:hypothetical protein
MALTMTRTRTQTTLTKLALMVANAHGELDFVDGLLARGEGLAAVGDAAEQMLEAGKGTGALVKGVGDGLGNLLTKEVHARLLARRQKLTADRDALYATIKRFDPALEPADAIGSADDWKRKYGRRGLGVEKLATRYLAHSTN